MVRTLACVMVLVAALGSAARLRAQTAPGTSPFDYALFALKRVRVGAQVQVFSGDIGANVGTVILGPGARIGGNVAAFSIRLGKGAHVARRFFCLFLDGATRAQCRDVNVPFVPDSALPLVQVAPGTTGVHVRAGQILAPLAAGVYGRVRLEAHAGVLLAGGTYALRALRLAPRAQLVCAAPCRIEVLDAVRVGAGAQVRPEASLAGGAVEIDVAAAGAPPAFRAGAGAAVTATVYAPAGAVVLGAGGQYQGSFVGTTVTVGAQAQVLSTGS